MSKRGGSLSRVACLTLLLLGGQVFSQKNDASVSPDGKTKAVVNGKGFSLFDVATGKELLSVKGHQDLVTAVTFSPDGKIIASGGKDKVIHLWEAATGKQLRTFQGGDVPLSLTFSQDGKNLSARGADKTTRTWDAATGKLVSTEKDK